MLSGRWLLCSMSCVVVACGGGEDEAPGALFELDGELTGDGFFDFPFPSDLRVDADGTAAYAGFPNKGANRLVTQLTALADARRGFPVMASAYFRFAEALPARAPSELIAASVDAPILYVDVDPDSPDRGKLVPIVAQTLQPDDTAAAFLLGVGPRPGWVNAPATTYAVVVRRAFTHPGRTPSGARGAELVEVYAPLWPVLDELGVARDDVLTATVFTTGDEVALLHERSEAIRAAHDAVIANVRLDPADGAAHDGYCELLADVTFPQFQAGVAPYSSDGQFVLDASGVPVKQGELVAPLVLTIPAGEMPAAGWPLYQFFHGSGGLSSGLVDLGKTLVAGGDPVVGEGPGYVVARHGIAAAASALPLNPERYANASDYEYLNLVNLGAFPYTFQQGVIEQRLLLDALLELAIPPAALAGCSGPTLPSGVVAHRFDGAKLTAGGQSMGGMYTNMIGAVEPRLGALVPTGAGGYWSKMILDTDLIAGARGFVGGVFATDETQLTFLHPGLALISVGWEIAEPMASMARLARRPPPGFPARHVYEPVGLDDVYFPTEIFDAAALAYGNRQAGAALWPELQEALALDGLGGLETYPVSANVGGKTRVVVQFASDGIADSHYIYRQLDEVKHQYGCFLASYVRTGTPVVPAPAALATPCD
ncbi:MAG: hypothetical protein K8M05_07370 [Deltaproteobacteria bacterium]|nr:hypothetical protein [Kofleriaceae bacterium]